MCENSPCKLPHPTSTHPHKYFSYTLLCRRAYPSVMSKLQWLPIALGMISKLLPRAYKACYYRGPAYLPNLLIWHCCPLARPDSTILRCSPYLSPALKSLPLLFPLPGSLTSPLSTNSCFLSLGPSFTHTSPEGLPHEVIQQNVLRTCSRPGAAEYWKSPALLELAFKLDEKDNKQINQEIHIFSYMWKCHGEEKAVKVLRGE